MRDHRDLGELGESTLRAWAAQRGINSIKSSPDKNGWDFLLEFPPTDEDPLLQSTSIRCLVQVKSTDRKKRSCQVKLSNWLRLIDWEIPVFFLILEFNHKDDPERAFLVHLDKHHIEQALKKKRQLDVEDQHQYHRHSLTLRYHEIHELLPLNGDGLGSAIRRHVGESPESYVRNKLHLRESLGYEEGRGIARITFPSNDLNEGEFQERIADLRLGLRDALEVERIEVFDSRFGIHSPTPSHTLNSGEIAIEPNPIKVEMILAAGPKRLIAKADLFYHSWQGNNFKIRIKSNFLDLVRSTLADQPRSIRIIIPDLGTETSITAWREFSSLVSVFDSANRSQTEIDYEIKHQSIRLLGGKISLKSTLSPTLQELAEAVNAAWTISKHFDLHDIAQPSLAQIIGQREKLSALKELLGPNSVPIKFGGPLKSGQIPAESRVIVLFGIEARLGEYRILAAFSISGELTIDNDPNQHEVNTYERKLAESLYTKISETKPSLSDVIHSVADSYDEDAICIIPSWYVE